MSSKINGQISTDACSHLLQFRRRNGPASFRALQDCLRVKPPGGRAAIRRDTAEVPCCQICGESGANRLYACVACAAISCHAPPLSHAAAHAQSMSPGHEIAVDVDRAELFCCECRDQVYDRDFDTAFVLAQTTATGSTPMQCSAEPGNLRKRRRVEYHPWTPDLRDRSSMINLFTPLHDSTDSLDVPWGLRGLNNLGNTCFMNSVLQALLHTPLLRNYFLSDRHNRYHCQQKNGASNGGKNGRLCLACDMDALFSAVFSGDRTPYSPAKFLYSWWQHAANLASYEQQDAHEFFISILHRIHEKEDKEQGKPHSQGSGDCCIAHRVFSGILRSDVMCMACGFTSTTYDPCIDFPLDLGPNRGRQAKSLSTKSHNSSNVEADSISSSQENATSTLKGCLEQFTRPERLGSDQKFFCQKCQVRQECLKQLSIRKLPLVSCFHIKRFEHSSSRKMSQKVDRHLQFPFSLNMAPFLSSSILRSRFGHRSFPFDGDEQDSANELSELELFAVVTHSGKLDGGHYVTYLRFSNQWYKCDDAWITKVSESIVRAAQGYMIFYVQKMLHYKAIETFKS